MGLPLFEFLVTSNKVIYPDNAEYKSLFPQTNLSKEIQDEIINEYYSRLTSESIPQAWLRRWHNFIKRRAVSWNTLLASETALRADDAIYNYDMVETYTEKSTGAGENGYSGTTNNTDESTSKANGQNYTSDTPDGSLDDIENYMSSGGRDESTATSSNTGKTDSTSESNSNYTSDTTHTLTRKGNIGVMTSAQIIGGYRDAVTYSCYDTIFGECAKYFLGVWGEDDNGYLYTTY